MDWLSNWTDNIDVIVTADSPPYLNWSDWDADQRDLYILDHENIIVYHQNITNSSNFNQSLITNMVIDLINNIPNNEILGDINGDQSIDILDVVILVNLVIDNQDFNFFGDINNDGINNVLDIVLLVNIILGNVCVEVLYA